MWRYDDVVPDPGILIDDSLLDVATASDSDAGKIRPFRLILVSAHQDNILKNCVGIDKGTDPNDAMLDRSLLNDAAVADQGAINMSRANDACR